MNYPIEISTYNPPARSRSNRGEFFKNICSGTHEGIQTSTKSCGIYMPWHFPMTYSVYLSFYLMYCISFCFNLFQRSNKTIADLFTVHHPDWNSPTRWTRKAWCPWGSRWAPHWSWRVSGRWPWSEPADCRAAASSGQPHSPPIKKRDFRIFWHYFLFLGIRCRSAKSPLGGPGGEPNLGPIPCRRQGALTTCLCHKSNLATPAHPPQT